MAISLIQDKRKIGGLIVFMLLGKVEIFFNRFRVYTKMFSVMKFEVDFSTKTSKTKTTDEVEIMN